MILLERANRAAHLLDECRLYRLMAYGAVDCIDANGVQAYLVVEPSGARSVVIPGTGFAVRGARSEWLPDWIANLRSVVPVLWRGQVPKAGNSGRLWPWGFLTRARSLDEEMRKRGWLLTPFMLCGHSQGAAIVQILAWSWRDDTAVASHEAHAIAAPRACFSDPGGEMLNLHCWLGPDDPVVYVPVGARHIGNTHWLPPLIGRLGYRHSAQGYQDRIADEFTRSPAEAMA